MTETTEETTETTETTEVETNWYDGLSEDIRTDENVEVLKGFESQDALISEFLKVREGIPVIPEASDKYEFADLPEGVEFDDKAMLDFKEFCFNQKVPNETANELLKMHLSDIPRITEVALNHFKDEFNRERKEARESCENALKDEWKGEAFNANKEVANSAFQKICEFTKIDPASLTDFGNDPNVIKIFHAIGTKMSEDSWHTGGPSSGGEKSAGKTLYPDMK